MSWNGLKPTKNLDSNHIMSSHNSRQISYGLKNGQTMLEYQTKIGSKCLMPGSEDHNLEEAVKKVLQSTCEIFDKTQHTHSQLHTDSEAHERPTSDKPGWAIKRRGELINQIDIFRKVVDT